MNANKIKNKGSFLQNEQSRVETAGVGVRTIIDSSQLGAEPSVKLRSQIIRDKTAVFRSRATSLHSQHIRTGYDQSSQHDVSIRMGTKWFPSFTDVENTTKGGIITGLVDKWGSKDPKVISRGGISEIQKALDKERRNNRIVFQSGIVQRSNET